MKARSKGRVGFLTLALATVLVGGCQSRETPPSGGVWPAESWQVSTPLEEGIDPTAIDSIVADMDSGVYGLVDHFLLIRHGRIVADRHFTQDYEAIAAQYDTTDHQYNYDHPAWHPYLRDTDLHTLQSVTKSVTSAALGAAIDEGLIEGVDVPVARYLEDYPQESDPRRNSVKLADLLTMRSGIEWNTSGPYDTGEHSTDLLESSDTWIQFILDQPMDTERAAREDPPRGNGPTCRRVGSTALVRAHRDQGLPLEDYARRGSRYRGRTVPLQPRPCPDRIPLPTGRRVERQASPFSRVGRIVDLARRFRCRAEQ
jgi:hypothetical protein